MSNYLPTDYQSFIHTSRYARYVDGKGRESWSETVGRYMDNIVRPVLGDDSYVNQIEEAILNLEVMPSMRALMTAGPALTRDNTAGYNCSYLPVDDPKSFDEAMFILLCGTGVGFSVERQYVQKLPEVPDELFDSETTIVVKDSKEGWAKAYRQLVALLYSGEIPQWDISLVRPAGARLKTFGGRASGPAPLVDLFNFTIKHRGLDHLTVGGDCEDTAEMLRELTNKGARATSSAEKALTDLVKRKGAAEPQPERLWHRRLAQKVSGHEKSSGLCRHYLRQLSQPRGQQMSRKKQ